MWPTFGDQLVEPLRASYHLSAINRWKATHFMVPS
jgi:hypothetical protein